jgi:regulator of replication initiation timing
VADLVEECDALRAELDTLKEKLIESTSDSDSKVRQLMHDTEMLKQKLGQATQELKVCKKCAEADVEKSQSITQIELLQKRLVFCSQELEDERKKVIDIVKERDALREEHTTAAAIHKPKVQLI